MKNIARIQYLIAMVICSLFCVSCGRRPVEIAKLHVPQDEISIRIRQAPDPKGDVDDILELNVTKSGESLVNWLYFGNARNLKPNTSFTTMLCCNKDIIYLCTRQRSDHAYFAFQISTGAYWYQSSDVASNKIANMLKGEGVVPIDLNSAFNMP